MQKPNLHAQKVIDTDAAVRKRIQSVRLQLGITQADLAGSLGIVPQQYHKYESGVLRLSGGMLVQIAKALDCSLLDLVPEDVRQAGDLGPGKKLDILKQELSMLILDSQSEDVLIAVMTLLKHADKSFKAE